LRKALTAWLALVLATPPSITLGEDAAAGPLLEGDRVRLEGWVPQHQRAALRIRPAPGKGVAVSLSIAF
jgi:hypothetical protein